MHKSTERDSLGGETLLSPASPWPVPWHGVTGAGDHHGPITRCRTTSSCSSLQEGWHSHGREGRGAGRTTPPCRSVGAAFPHPLSPQWLQGWPMGVPVVIWPARQRCPWHKVLQLTKEGHQHQEKCVCPVLAAGEPSKQACGAEGSEDNRGIRRGEDRCCV